MRIHEFPKRDNDSLCGTLCLCADCSTLFCLHKRLSSSALASVCTENIQGTGPNYSKPNGITGDKREHAFQAILSTLSRNEMGFCMRNIVVSKHKASLCSTASSSENSRQTEDQLQRWKWGQGGFFSSSSSSLNQASPLAQLCKMREHDVKVLCFANVLPSWARLSDPRLFSRCLYGNTCGHEMTTCSSYTTLTTLYCFFNDPGLQSWSLLVCIWYAVLSPVRPPTSREFCDIQFSSLSRWKLDENSLMSILWKYIRWDVTLFN